MTSSSVATFSDGISSRRSYISNNYRMLTLLIIIFTLNLQSKVYNRVKFVNVTIPGRMRSNIKTEEIYQTTKQTSAAF